MARVHHIVFTGGPCGGKTSLESKAHQVLGDLGKRVFTIPEAATQFINGGVDVVHLAQHDRSAYLDVQEQILRVQLMYHQAFSQLAASSDEDVCVIHDRGALDNGAYMTPEEFAEVISRIGVDMQSLLDMYDMVIHLRTAAAGAEQFYTTANNTARSETPQLARQLDEMTMKAWLDHPRLQVIDNSTDFEGKMRRALEALTSHIGERPVRTQRRFLLVDTPSESVLDGMADRIIDIEQFYFAPPSTLHELRLRKRVQDGRATWHKAEILNQTASQRAHVERVVSDREAQDLLQSMRHVGMIAKQRFIVVENGEPLRIDRLSHPGSVVVLELDVVEHDQPVSIPAQLGHAVEITAIAELSSARLATYSDDQLARLLDLVRREENPSPQQILQELNHPSLCATCHHCADNPVSVYCSNSFHLSAQDQPERHDHTPPLG